MIETTFHDEPTEKRGLVSPEVHWDGVRESRHSARRQIPPWEYSGSGHSHRVFKGHLALIGEETAHNLSLQVSPEKFKLLTMLENESTKLFEPIILVCQIKENWGGATETSHCSEIQPLFSLCYYVYRRHVSRWEVIYTCLRMKMSTRCSHVYAQHSSWPTFFKIKTNYSMESTYSCSYIWLP